MRDGSREALPDGAPAGRCAGVCRLAHQAEGRMIRGKYEEIQGGCHASYLGAQ